MGAFDAAAKAPEENESCASKVLPLMGFPRLPGHIQ
jgi:hypothetical protein